MSLPIYQEQWRSVFGAEDQRYLVSDLGRVKYTPTGQIRKPSFGRNGYLALSLRTPQDGQRTFRVAHLVCTLFHGACPESATLIRHLNDNRVDNRAANLAWGTEKDNAQDRLRNGRNAEANRTHCPQGHPYDATTIGRTGSVWRRCKTCRAAWQRAYEKRKRDAGKTKKVGV